VSWQTLVSRTNFKPAIVLSVPVRDENQIVGVMAAGVNIDIMSKQIATWKRGETGYAFLVDDTDKVVAHQIEKYVIDQVNLGRYPLVTEYKKGKRNPIFFKDSNGISCMGMVKETKYGWLLCVQQNEEEIFQVLKAERNFAYIILGSTVLGILIFAWLSGRMITKPIKDITNAADLISIGELDVPIHAKSKDEIGELAGAIIRMQESIRVSLERLRKKRQGP
jgi:methyl-accepting chemotaxis protein